MSFFTVYPPEHFANTGEPNSWGTPKNIAGATKVQKSLTHNRVWEADCPHWCEYQYWFCHRAEWRGKHGRKRNHLKLGNHQRGAPGSLWYLSSKCFKSNIDKTLAGIHHSCKNNGPQELMDPSSNIFHVITCWELNNNSLKGQTQASQGWKNYTPACTTFWRVYIVYSTHKIKCILDIKIWFTSPSKYLILAN